MKISPGYQEIGQNEVSNFLFYPFSIPGKFHPRTRQIFLSTSSIITSNDSEMGIF